MAPSEAHTVAEPAQNGLRRRPQPSARARWSIVDLTVQIPSARTSGAQTPQQNAPQPRWKTKEFYFYYFVFATIVPQMWYIPHCATNGV